MKSHSCRMSILVVSLLLPSSAAVVKADDDPNEPLERRWLAEVPCSAKDKPPYKRIDVSPEAVICLNYEQSELRRPKPGEPIDVNLDIVSYVQKGNRNPTVTKPPTIEDPGRFPGVSINSKGEAPGNGELTSWLTYRYKLRIDEQVRPLFYTVEFSTSEAKDTLTFKLPFAPANGESVFQPTIKSQKILSCWSGGECDDVGLNIVNTLPHYKFTITDVLMTTTPQDLLERHAKFDPEIKASPTDQSISIKAAPKSISLPRIFGGFGKSPTAIMTIYFTDDFGRDFNKDVSIELEMKPNYFILSITLLLGAVIGTFVRIDLQRLQKAGIITRRQKIVFVLTTCGSGVLVCLVALFANLRLSVFEADGLYSAWDPKVLFLMGLVGTIGGIPILYALLKLPPPKPDGTQEQAPTPPTPPTPATPAPQGGAQ